MSSFKFVTLFAIMAIATWSLEVDGVPTAVYEIPECFTEEFRCADSTCIPKWDACDGFNNCGGLISL